MSSSGTLRSRIADQRLDVLAAVAGLMVALLLFPMRFLASQIYVETIPVVVGAACLLYLFTVRRRIRETGLPELSGGFARASAGITVGGLGIMAALAGAAGRRTTPFFLLAGVVTAVLLMQILFTSETHLDARLVLTEILLLSFVVRFTGLYLTPGFVGYDTWTHVYDYARAILNQHSLSAIADVKYFTAPLYHLLVVVTVELLGTTLRQALYVSVGTLMAVSVLFVYAAARYFVPVRWALFAATMFTVSDQVVRWSLYNVPTSLGLFFFGLLVYVTVRLFYTESRQRNLVLTAFASMAIILTHQVSSFIMLVFIGAGVAAQLLVGFSDRFGWDLLRVQATGRERINLLALLAFNLVFLVVLWSVTPYVGGTFLGTTIDWFVDQVLTSSGFLDLAGQSGGGGDGGGGSDVGSLAARLAKYYDSAGILLLLFVAVLGSLVTIRRSETLQRAYTFIGATALFLFFALGLPLFGITSLLPTRWFAFTHLLMILVGAVGLYYLSHGLPRSASVAVLVVFAVAFPHVMFVSYSGTQDNPVFSEQRVRLTYTETELEAARSIEEIRPRSDERLYTDHPYWTVYRRNSSYVAGPLTMESDGDIAPREIVAYRTYQTEYGAKFLGRDGKATLDEVCPPATMDRLYTNGDVRLCVARGPDDTD